MSTAPRILSLIPAATDWVEALGLGEHLVGVTHECEAAQQVPVVVEPAVRHDPSDPAGVDAAVAEAAAGGRALYRVDEDLVADLAPTVMVTQQLCEVCAVPASQLRRLAERLGGCALVTLDGVTLEGVLRDGLRLGDAVDRGGVAQEVVDALRVRVGAVADAVAGRRRPRVAFLEWPDPPWAAGHWVPDQIDLAGGRPVAGVSGEPSQRVGWEAFAGADVLAVGPCGYGLEEAAAAAEAVADRLPDAEQVWAFDAHHCFSRPAPRLVDGVEALAGVLHPGAAGEPDPAVARALTATRAGGAAR